MTAITPEPIIQLASWFMAAKHLFVANEIGLFDKLALGPATLERLAELTGIGRARVRILADALVAFGLIERQGNKYRNGLVAATFLGGEGPVDLRPLLRLWNHIAYPMWMKLEEARPDGTSAGHHAVVRRTSADLFGGSRSDTDTAGHGAPDRVRLQPAPPRA